MQPRNARLGLVFFAVYLVLYAGFVLLAAFSPESMETTPAAGVNVAIWYGFALIIAAFVMALLYGWLCRVTADPTRPAPGALSTTIDFQKPSAGGEKS